jgi:glycosyltransferase involved in cell wall biosynthesis
MSQPLISICIATYKRPELLKKLLGSISIQTFKDFEILVNDNSPDDSVESVIQSYKNILTINYEKNDPAVSAGMNCNKVMRRAQGHWIKLMHDDDWFEGPDALGKFADAALHTGKDFIFSASNQVRLDSGESKPAMFTEEKKRMLDDSPLCLFYGNIIGQPSLTMHKRYPGLEYDASFNFLLDIDFYMRYLFAHPGYHYIDQRLINIGVSSQQETYKYYKNINVELPEYFTLLSKFSDDLNVNNQFAFYLIWIMIRRYKIKNPDQIYAVGYKGPMPKEINQIIACQKYIPDLILKQPPWTKKIMKRCFYKMTGRKADLIK